MIKVSLLFFPPPKKELAIHCKYSILFRHCKDRHFPLFRGQRKTYGISYTVNFILS